MRYNYDAAMLPYTVVEILRGYFDSLVGVDVNLESCDFFGNGVWTVVNKFRSDIPNDDFAADLEIRELSPWRALSIESKKIEPPVWDVSRVDIISEPRRFVEEAAASLAYELMRVIFDCATPKSRLGRIQAMMDVTEENYHFCRDDFLSVSRKLNVTYWRKHGKLINAIMPS